jgi:hypothetical protein
VACSRVTFTFTIILQYCNLLQPNIFKTVNSLRIKSSGKYYILPLYVYTMQDHPVHIATPCLHHAGSPCTYCHSMFTPCRIPLYILPLYVYTMQDHPVHIATLCLHHARAPCTYCHSMFTPCRITLYILPLHVYTMQEHPVHIATLCLTMQDHPVQYIYRIYHSISFCLNEIER